MGVLEQRGFYTFLHIEICQDQHPIDYQIVKKWIDQMNNDV